MKRTRTILRSTLLVLILVGGFSAVGTAAGGGNRCKDRCNDRYRIRKDVCRAIPLKSERKACEHEAKRARDDCKHKCR